MPINVNTTPQQIGVTVGETQIDVSVGGGVGPTGNSGTVAVSAPITNAGTSTAAVIGLSVGTGLAVSGGSLAVTYGTTAGTTCQGNDARLSDARTPLSHTHTSSQITDFASAVVAAAPPTTNASLLTSGTLPDARLSSNIARTSDVSSAVAAVVNAAPATLDTLNELAAALGNDANFATTVTNALAAKAPIASPTFTGTVSGITKAMVGLGNVDNTSDANKPISTATQTALDGKAASAHTHTASAITDFTAAVVAAAPPTTDASLLTAGTLSASRLPSTTVSAGSYGSASSVATFTVDAAGRLTAAGSSSIAIAAGAVTSGVFDPARIPRFDVRSDTVGSTSYIGRAAAGSATSASVWTIRRSIFTSAGAVSSTATATNVAWDNRLTATYS